MHIGIDQDKGLYFIPKELYQSFADEIIVQLKNFMIKEENDNFIVIQTPEKLLAKKDGILFFKGEKKEEKTCLFCSKRVRCTTNGWRCDGYVAGKSFTLDPVEIENFFSEKSTIIFAKVE